MKKILLIIFTILLFFIIPKNTYAKSFGYDSIDFDVLINKDGSVDITESNTYNFKGSHNGILRDIDVADLGPITIEEIYSTSNKDDSKVVYTKTNGSNAGDYNLNIDNNLAKLKVYAPSKDEIKTFTYKYKLENAVIKYNDIAQLNWRIFDSIDQEVKNVSIKLSFEQTAKKEDLRIFVHGPLWGNSVINNDGTIDILVSDVPEYTLIEVNALFPILYVPNAKKIYNQNALDSILSQEKGLADDANAYREQAKDELQKRENSFIKSAGISIVAAIACVIAFIKLYTKFDKELPTNFDGEYFRELPADYSPAVLSYLINETRLNKKELLPTLLNLVLKDYLRLELKTEENKGLFSTKEKEVMIFYKTDKNPNDLTNHEKFLIDWLIDDLGKGECFNFTMLDSLKKSNIKIKKFGQMYDKWTSLIESESAEYDFFESKFKAMSYSAGIVVVLIFIGIVGYLTTNLVGFFAFGIAGFIILVYSTIITKKTPKGQDDYTKWMALKRFLKDFSLMNEHELKSIVIWEHFLVYGITLGVSKEVIKNMPRVLENATNYDDSRIFRTYGYMYPSRYDMMFRSFNNNIESINSSINNTFQSVETLKTEELRKVAGSNKSSGGGFGGGFSGGSSGGSGGGGGRGAF